MIFVYIMAIAPVLFNISLDTVIAYCTMPCYVVYMFADLYCMVLPKKYPDAWKRSFLAKIPLPIFYIFCIVSFGCSIFLCSCYCMGMGLIDGLYIVGFTILMFVYAAFCLKTGRVKKETLAAQRQAILDEIAEYEIVAE